MAIKYDLYQKPSSDSTEETLYHARIINLDTITTDRLAGHVEHATSLTEGDVKNVLSIISHQMVEYLSRGNRVHIEGLGYFQLSINSPTVSDPKDMRADYLKVKTINFQPEKRLKDKLADIKFQRTKRKRSPVCTHEEMMTWLEDYFKEYAFITRARFQDLCGLTRSTAMNRINELIEEGILAKSGGRGVAVYEWKQKL